MGEAAEKLDEKLKEELDKKLLELRAGIAKYRDSKDFTLLGKLRKLIKEIEDNGYKIEKEKEELRAILIIEAEQREWDIPSDLI